VYCLGADRQVVDCGSSNAPIEATSFRGPTRVTDAEDEQPYRDNSGLLAPRGRWFVVSVQAKDATPRRAALTADCGDGRFALDVVFRRVETIRDGFEHEFLAMFPGDYLRRGDPLYPCRVRVTMQRTNAKRRQHRTIPAHFVAREELRKRPRPRPPRVSSVDPVGRGGESSP
jgi:hypothetical protein